MMIMPILGMSKQIETVTHLHSHLPGPLILLQNQDMDWLAFGSSKAPTLLNGAHLRPDYKSRKMWAS